ncbi:DUF1858 domain-containing protein [Enterococcus nangangensis]|uniref:DUF1858 domain-containing protein n=1 Tax=Enterococcus nangangensis TaxID=2559926 RepID=UPI0010FA277D|nr:DUF1858 domain-containing protein [Enterococcus nangangensis]
MAKILDLNDSVYTLVQTYPEVKEHLVALGFKDIQNPGILNTMGRYVTIPKGARMKKKDLTAIIRYFEAQGFTVKGAD